jgi:hypothetical protein
MDWDNLRYFLELSRAGKLTAAARRLGVDHENDFEYSPMGFWNSYL